MVAATPRRYSRTELPADDHGIHEVNLIAISPGYFRTMQIPLLRGRGFNESDDGKADVLGIVIDSAAAQLYWRGRDALGAYARLGGPNGSRVRIVGIVGNVRNRGLGETTEAEVYLPAQALPVNPMHFVVRSTLPVATLAPAIRRSIQSVDPSQPFYDAQSMREIVLGSVTSERLAVVTYRILRGRGVIVGGARNLWSGFVFGAAEDG